MHSDHRKFMSAAINLARENVISGQGGPFGAIVVKDHNIIAEGVNRVTVNNDPTAHAEVMAIRKACQVLSSFQLAGCTIYSSCEPCPMCLGAIYWARPDCLYYANSKEDAANINFDDQFIYNEIGRSIEQRKLNTKQIMREEAMEVFALWQQSNNKIDY